jgi:phosphoadenosine phosphosulfate reductase
MQSTITTVDSLPSNSQKGGHRMSVQTFAGDSGVVLANAICQHGGTRQSPTGDNVPASRAHQETNASPSAAAANITAETILTPQANLCNPPTPEQLELLAEESRKLEEASPEEIIQWAVDHYFPKLTMATAFGPEGCVIISILAKIEPRVYVFNLETGYQFPETLELRDRLAERYGIVVDFQRPELSVEEYERLHGGPLYRTNPDQCCRDRKIAVARRVVKNYAAWMCGVRRDQSTTRAQTPIVGWDFKFGLVKIAPLARWTSKQVWARIMEENIPYNPLHDLGYASIGCWPCTRPIQLGEHERAGRWPGMCKTECGLHVIEER